MAKKNILFISQTDKRVYLRQTPGNKGIWSNYDFDFEFKRESYDWVVVYDDLNHSINIKTPKEHTLLITAEPETIKTYNKKYVSQFAHVITSQRKIPHPNPIFSFQALPWMIGLYTPVEKKVWYPRNYDDLKKTKIEKTLDKVSVIISNKIYTKQHKERLDFVLAFKKAHPDLIDVYGNGIKLVYDKWHGIAPYKYHLALENSLINDYWTEKISDAFLGEAYPFYAGCPNIGDYFPRDSFTPIDLDKKEESIEKIVMAIKNNLYTERKKDLKEAKNLVLDKYNVFNLVTNFVQKHNTQDKPKKITIFPQDKTSLTDRIKHILKNKHKKLLAVDPILIQ